MDVQCSQAAHRSTSLLLVLFYSHWPRLTLFYSYLFEYYTVYHPLGKAQFSSVVDQDVRPNFIDGLVMYM